MLRPWPSPFVPDQASRAPPTPSRSRRPLTHQKASLQPRACARAMALHAGTLHWGDLYFISFLGHRFVESSQISSNPEFPWTCVYQYFLGARGLGCFAHLHLSQLGSRTTSPSLPLAYWKVSLQPRGRICGLQVAPSMLVLSLRRLVPRLLLSLFGVT